MDIERFSDQYDEVAPLYGLTPAQLRGRTRDRWIARERSRIIAAAETIERPDARLFMSYKGDHRAAADLSRVVAEHHQRPVFTSTAPGSVLTKLLVAAGFQIELTTEHFVVRFDAALEAVRRGRLPVRYRLVDVSEADPDRLFELDNAVRNLVPGTDGWAGNRGWFDEELADPAAYRIAIDRTTGDYAGLARVWRNPDGPRFGLIGVLPTHSRPSPAPALLRAVLNEAATWGFETFRTETALTNLVVHTRLARLGSSTGRMHQLVLYPDA